MLVSDVFEGHEARDAVEEHGQQDEAGILKYAFHD